MSEITLEEFLSPISAALGRNSAPDAPSGTWDPAGGFHRDQYDSMSQDQLADWFVDEATALGTEMARCNADGVAEAVMNIIRAHEGKLIVYSNDKRTDDYGIAAAIDAEGLEGIRWDPARGREIIDICERADVGITYPFAAVARTSSVAQRGDLETGLSVALLPPLHIAVVEKSIIVPRMIDILEKIDPNEEMPSVITFITGPSSTADIELVRVVGVHGPVYFAIVVVEDR